jgi:hypothetical protein
MGAIYSVKTDVASNEIQETQVEVEDDFIEVKKPEKPILLIEGYMDKRSAGDLSTIYETESVSSTESEKESLSDSLKKSIRNIKEVLKRVESDYDIDFLENKYKLFLDYVFGI